MARGAGRAGGGRCAGCGRGWLLALEIEPMQAHGGMPGTQLFSVEASMQRLADIRPKLRQCAEAR